MRLLALVPALFLSAALATSAVGEEVAAPTNTICPVSGEPVKADAVVTVEVDGKMVSIACCGDEKCAEAIMADPAKYVAAAAENKKAE